MTNIKILYFCWYLEVRFNAVDPVVIARAHHFRREHFGDKRAVGLGVSFVEIGLHVLEEALPSDDQNHRERD